ncbi:hypothetical protein D1644_17285, partial [Neglecta sp. 59]|nr:hypothetical protein [Neglectibacter sp. 59]
MCKKAPMCHAFHNLTHRSRNLPTKGRSMEIVTQTAPPDKKGFYTMGILNKLQADELFRREAILIGRDDV